MTNRELHLKTKSVAKTYLQIEADLVALLIEMDRRRAFRDLGYASLFQYCVLELKLSEAVTSAFITVSRKAAVVPDLMEALETQILTVSKAAKITSALDIQHVEETKQVIKFASQHSAAETEKWLREKKGLETLHTLKIDSATMAKLKKARALTKRDFALEEILGLVLDEFIQKHDPIEKAKRSLGRSASGKAASKKRTPLPVRTSRNMTNAAYPVLSPRTESQTPMPERSPSVGIEHPAPKPTSNSLDSLNTKVLPTSAPPPRKSSARRPLPARIKHIVITRDKNRCTHEIRPGLRCPNDKFLEIHHRRPLQHGGADTPENLVLLCAAHHRHHHQDL
ncbi:MAG: HNH endonuclease [Bdellovibrionaceae bacterium]|nr:HNH endonuclease [Pseudobdellovibrionaceae bacterium]